VFSNYFNSRLREATAGGLGGHKDPEKLYVRGGVGVLGKVFVGFVY
jgi:hypothetical protein